MSTRRVLHCIPGMGGGGAERQLVYLARELPRVGWEVHVALASEGPNWPDLVASGATVHKLYLSGNHDPRLFLQLAKVIGRVQPSLVQVWMRQMEIVGGLLAAMRRVPWILSERSCSPAYPPVLKSRLRVLSAFMASAVVSNSKAGDRYWQSHLGNRVPRYVVPNALPLDRIAAAAPANPETLGLAAGKPLILFAGRFSPEKNAETLVRALARVFDGSDAVAVLAGDGPLRDRMRALAARQGIALRLRFPGYLENVWSWMKRAAVLVSPSTFEGHPNSVLEAMACGCPVVASDIEAHRAFLDDATAVFVPSGDPDRLAAAIVGVLAAPHAAAARADGARAVAQQWAAEHIAHAYAQVYDDVLGNGVVKPRRHTAISTGKSARLP